MTGNLAPSGCPKRDNRSIGECEAGKGKRTSGRASSKCMSGHVLDLSIYHSFIERVYEWPTVFDGGSVQWLVEVTVTVTVTVTKREPF